MRAELSQNLIGCPSARPEELRERSRLQRDGAVPPSRPREEPERRPGAVPPGVPTGQAAPPDRLSSVEELRLLIAASRWWLGRSLGLDGRRLGRRRRLRSGFRGPPQAPAIFDRHPLPICLIELVPGNPPPAMVARRCGHIESIPSCCHAEEAGNLEPELYPLQRRIHRIESVQLQPLPPLGCELDPA